LNLQMPVVQPAASHSSSTLKAYKTAAGPRNARNRSGTIPARATLKQTDNRNAWSTFGTGGRRPAPSANTTLDFERDLEANPTPTDYGPDTTY
jgi:hypothetical protein